MKKKNAVACRAVCLDLADKADVLEYYSEDVTVRSVTEVLAGAVGPSAACWLRLGASKHMRRLRC